MATMSTKEQIEFAQIRYDYENTKISIRDLSKKFNINYKKIERVCNKENWQRKPNLNAIDEIKVLDEFKTRVDTDLILSDDAKLTSTQLINSTFNIIHKMHELHKKSLRADEIIIDNLLHQLENNAIEYGEAVTLLQKLGAGIDKISAFYKEPAMTNIQINNNINKQEDEFNQVQFYIPEKSSI